jgi:predicted Zn-dependent protease
MKNHAVLLVVALLLASCAVNPVTGDRQLALVSESQEIQIGSEVAKSAEQQFGLVDDQELQDYVHRLGMQLAKASERPELPWSFKVVDDPTPNAFAAPGGYIYITRGLLALMHNEAELVSVLGHEIGHVTARHSVAMISRQQLAQLGLGLGSVLSPTVAQFSELAAGGLQVLFLSYSRDAERQADDLGFRYALEQGYDVREMTNVFASFERASDRMGGNDVPSWLQSHPDPGNRISRIEERLEKLDQPLTGHRVGEEEYLDKIEGLTYGKNPRHGYFEENRFLHPDMAFRIDFPSGWRTQNLAQAVVAGSPEQDAIIQMTLAEGSLQEAAQQFFTQQGLVAGRRQSQTINGLDAITGAFEAQTEQGKIGGVAAMISHDGRVYRIVAFTPAERRAAYEPTFRSTIGSFAPLTDKAALARKPDRLEIMRLPREMTVAEFYRTYPSSVPVEEVALLNQRDGPDAVLPANFRAKRVVDD